ncbi:MAG: inositol monophosphatase family protein [Burkholderiales bacterium]
MIDALIAAVREVARDEILPRFRAVPHARKADGSVVTEADLAAQRALGVRLEAILACPLVGEEMHNIEREAALADAAGTFWCVDPLDGTSNFANAIPFFAVSVALIENGRPVLGVVYNPVTDELFHARRNGGAFLGDEPLPLRSGAKRLAESIAGVDLKRLPHPLPAVLAAKPPYHSQRNFGAGTLEWSYLAAGRLDLYLHGGQHLWDYAAGSLILDEAGGRASTLEGRDLWGDPPGKRSVIAALDPDAFDAWTLWVRGATRP